MEPGVQSASHPSIRHDHDKAGFESTKQSISHVSKPDACDTTLHTHNIYERTFYDAGSHDYMACNKSFVRSPKPTDILLVNLALVFALQNTVSCMPWLTINRHYVPCSTHATVLLEISAQIRMSAMYVLCWCFCAL